MNLRFELDRESIVSYDTYPDSIVVGLAKIGGLVAIFRISYLLNSFNKYFFERRIAEKVHTGGAETDQNILSHDRHNNMEGGI